MISVIIRNFNNSSTIERAIKSVLSQTLSLSEIEMIVIDDSSEDDSVSKIKAFKKNIRFFETKRIGALRVLNFGLREARGKYYTILDSDDYLPLNALKELKRGFEENPRVAGVYGDYYELNVKSSRKRYYSTKDNVFSTVAGGWLLKKNIVAGLGYYDIKLFFPEYDLLKKILKKYKVVHIPEIVYYYCRRFGSMTFDKKEVEEGIKQLEEKYGGKIQIRKY